MRSSFNNGVNSNLISCTNTDISPYPISQGQIKYIEAPTHAPSDGVSIFSRIVSSYSTLVIDGGQIILAPGQSIVVYLGGFLPIDTDSIKVAFGWWEESNCKCNNCFC